MKFSEMKKAAQNWLADQKLWMSTMVNPESINRDGDIAEGFIDALRLLRIYSANQAKAAYRELRVARDAAIKEAALGVGSTGSGKGDHPKKDDSLNHKFSVDENPPAVKIPQETARELADTLLRLIGSMRKAHINEHSIVETLVLALKPGKEGK